MWTVGLTIKNKAAFSNFLRCSVNGDLVILQNQLLYREFEKNTSFLDSCTREYLLGQLEELSLSL